MFTRIKNWLNHIDSWVNIGFTPELGKNTNYEEGTCAIDPKGETFEVIGGKWWKTEKRSLHMLRAA